MGFSRQDTEVVCHFLLQWTTFCQTSPPWPTQPEWPHMAWLSFIELDKAVVHYTMEETDRLKGLVCLRDRMAEELWTEVPDIVQEAVIKTITKKKKCKKAKLLSEEDLQIAEKKGEAKGKREKERCTHLNAEF